MVNDKHHMKATTFLDQQKKKLVLQKCLSFLLKEYGTFSCLIWNGIVWMDSTQSDNSKITAEHHYKLCVHGLTVYTHPERVNYLDRRTTCPKNTTSISLLQSHSDLEIWVDKVQHVFV